MKEIMTKEYILECLERYCNFEGLSEDTFYELVAMPLSDNQCFNNWTWDNGVTKGVLIFKDLDFVVKIPFQGRYCYTESHYENTNGNWTLPNTSKIKYYKKIEGTEEFFNFEGSPAEDSEWNYCQAEAEITIRAKEKGIENCIAATKLLGYAGDHPIYIQEKCFMFSDASSSTNKEKYKNRTKKDYDTLRAARERTDFWGIDDNWVLDFLIYWGEEVMKKLSEFIFENDIEDLHNGNIGYRHGVPCLVDYSSYRE